MPVLELRGITKSFPGVKANQDISLTLEKGEIHALLGENGAGKTTLMNILYGLYRPDEGEILINDQKVDIEGPNDAIARGIGMVHQHFMLVPVMTVTENVMLGNETTKSGVFLDREKVSQRIREISNQYGLEVDPEAYIKDLPVGIQQRVEIIKVLYRQADILILDEPTAVLTPQEVDGLFKIIHSLIDAGKSLIFITHKLKEVLHIADRITVLRLGKVVGSAIPGEVDEQKLAEMMVGREVNLVVNKTARRPQGRGQRPRPSLRSLRHQRERQPRARDGGLGRRAGRDAGRDARAGARRGERAALRRVPARRRRRPARRARRRSDRRGRLRARGRGARAPQPRRLKVRRPIGRTDRSSRRIPYSPARSLSMCASCAAG